MATPEGWTVTSLGAVCDLRMGGTPARKEAAYWDTEKKTENRWVAISDIRRRFLYDTAEYISDQGVEKSPVKRIEPGIPLMSFKLTIGRATIPRVPVYTNEAIVALVPRKPIVREYLFYAVPPIASAAVATDAVKGKTLNKEMMQQLLILLPPLPEQRKIAAILSAVDEVIEKTEAVIESLQALKKAMMQELLTRGLPGRHTRFKQTEIGEVPEEWEVVPFGAILKRGPDNGLYRPKEDYGTGTPIVRIDSFASGDTLPSGGYQRVRLCADDVLRFRLSESEIVINRVNSLSHLAKAAYVGLLDEPTVFESNMMRVGVDGERVLPRFAFLWIASEMARAFFLARAKQAVAQASVNQQDVKTMPLPLPPFSEQETIVSTLDSLLKRIETESVVLNSAQSTKQALMSVLLTGELRVTPDQDAA